MRLDLYLKLSRLVPRRTLAQQMCEAGAVRLNGSPAKSAREVRVGDEIAIRQGGRVTTVRVGVTKGYTQQRALQSWTASVATPTIEGITLTGPDTGGKAMSLTW